MNLERYRKTKIASALYIDDDETSATTEKTNFKQYGIEATVVSDSAKAVEKYQETNPDIVIIDLEFAGQPKNGIDVLVDLFKYDNHLNKKIVLPNSSHMNEKDDLGVKFWNKWIELFKQEPTAIIDKLKDTKANDLVWVLGHLIEEKVGEIDLHPELRAYTERRDQEY